MNSRAGKIALTVHRGSTKDDIHNAAMDALRHLAAHGDIGHCNRLFNAMPKGPRRIQVSNWFQAFGKVEFNADRATRDGSPFVYARKKENDLARAEATPWHALGPKDDKASETKNPRVEEVFDLQAALAALLRRATRPGVRVKQPELLRGLEFLTVKPTAPGMLKDSWLYNKTRPMPGGRVSPR